MGRLMRLCPDIPNPMDGSLQSGGSSSDQDGDDDTAGKSYYNDHDVTQFLDAAIATAFTLVRWVSALTE